MSKTKVGEKTMVLKQGVPGEARVELPRNFKNISAKERELLLKAWNKDKKCIDGGLNIELTKSQREELAQVVDARPKNKDFSQSVRQVVVKGIKGVTVNKGVKGVNAVDARRLSLPNEAEIVAAKALTQLPQSVLPLPTTTTISTTVASSGATTASIFAAPCTVLSVRSNAGAAVSCENVGVPENTMGKLRSGKEYSPSRALGRSTPVRRSSPYSLRDVGKDRVEKRRQSTSPMMEPTAKRQYSASSPLQLSDLEASGNSRLSEVDQNDMDVENPALREDGNSGPLLAVVERMMQSTLTEIKKHNAQITDELAASIKKNESNIVKLGKDLAAASNSLSEFKNAQSSKFIETDEKLLKMDKQVNVNTNKLSVLDSIVSDHSTTLDEHTQKFEDHKEHNNIRLEKLERENAELRRIINNNPSRTAETLEDDFPMDCTIVMLRTVINEGKSAMDVARLILADVLGLAVSLRKAEVMRKFPNGKSSIKVELGSPDEVNTVMKEKAVLGSVNVKDIRGVWIRRSKTRRQRIQDHNNSVMLKALKLQGKYRQDALGRLIPVAAQSESNVEGQTAVLVQPTPPAELPSHLSMGQPMIEGRAGGTVRGAHHGRGRGRAVRGRRGGGNTNRRTPPEVSNEVAAALSLARTSNSSGQSRRDDHAAVKDMDWSHPEQAGSLNDVLEQE